MTYLEELEKGCKERCFCEHNKDNLKCGTLWNNDKHYCLKCIGLIEGYLKGIKDTEDKILQILREFMKFCDNGFRATGELEMQRKSNELYNRIKELSGETK
jgi:hypothetical protein